MTYLLDTCVISDFIRGEPKVVSKMLSLPPNAIAVSTISRMEVEYGLSLNEERAKNLRPKIKVFFDSVHLLPFSGEDAVNAADVRSKLKKAGLPVGPCDILLAGAALNRDLVFVTSNDKEFQRVDGLRIENWISR